MNGPPALPVGLSRFQSLVLCILLLAIMWGVSRIALSLESWVVATLVGIPFGVGGGYLGARAEAGQAIFSMTKPTWWAFVLVAAIISAFDPTYSNRFLLGVMSGSMIVSYLASFAVFHLKFTRPQ